MPKQKSKRLLVLIDVFWSIAKSKKCWNMWRTIDQWLESMLLMYPEIKTMNYTKIDLNRVLAVDPVLKHCFMNYGSMTNHHGIYLDCKQFKKRNMRQFIAVSQILLSRDLHLTPNGGWHLQLDLPLHKQSKRIIPLRSWLVIGGKEEKLMSQHHHPQEQCAKSLHPLHHHQQSLSCPPINKAIRQNINAELLGLTQSMYIVFPAGQECSVGHQPENGRVA